MEQEKEVVRQVARGRVREAVRGGAGPMEWVR
jgi:hypothetical protein